VAAPNRNSIAILGQMLDEFKKQGVSQRVGTHSFGNQLRATLAALRKTDEGWWSVKIRTEVRWNPSEARMEVVVSLLEQDTYRGPKTNRPEKSVEQLLPATSYGLPKPRVPKTFTPPGDMEWRDQWNWDEEFQGRLDQGEDAGEALGHIQWKKEQVNDPAKRKEYFTRARQGMWDLLGRDPGEQDPRLVEGSSNGVVPLDLPPETRAEAAKRLPSQAFFDRFFPAKPPRGPEGEPSGEA